MVLSNTNNSESKDYIQITGETETLTCKYCGEQYPSIGKHDPGYCKECGLMFLSGPLDGKKVGEILDNYRSKTETD